MSLLHFRLCLVKLEIISKITKHKTLITIILYQFTYLKKHYNKKNNDGIIRSHYRIDGSCIDY